MVVFTEIRHMLEAEDRVCITCSSVVFLVKPGLHTCGQTCTGTKGTYMYYTQ